MITITTRFVGPTDYRPSRVICRAPGRPWRVTVPWDDCSGEQHEIAPYARALAAFERKYFSPHRGEGAGWRTYHYGGTDDGYAFIAMRPEDSVADCVWVHCDGRYSLTRPEGE